MEITEFTHQPPNGYSYHFLPFKRNVTSIWINHLYKFDYNHGADVSCIWGFYNSKTKKFHAPINSKTVGDVVNFDLTTPYSAMQIKSNALERALWS